MSVVYRSEDRENPVVVELKDPRIAAVLGWLWPGAGHFYQRRFTKGFIFMICIMGTYLYGLGLGQGRSVYASFRDNDFRWQFICQSGVGLPSLFAVVQAQKVKSGDPFFVLCERYPADTVVAGTKRDFEIISDAERASYKGEVLKDGLMAPPTGPIYPEENDVLGMWHAEMRQNFDVGTLFCVVAGLLNILAVYDAFAGPAIIPSKKKAGEETGQDDVEESEEEDDES